MGKKTFVFGLFILLTIILLITGCSNKDDELRGRGKNGISTQQGGIIMNEEQITVTPTSVVTQLEEGLFAVQYNGDYGFDNFLSQGGASSDKEVAAHLAENLLGGLNLDFLSDIFGCSTISVKNDEGQVLFGRNFDWENCDAMVVVCHPENGYDSISTVNMNFVGQAAGIPLDFDKAKILASLYAPLDGMNEKGLAVSVNMIEDSAAISQNTDKPDITTTTAIRLMLDRAANVEEALKLLKQYDMHASMGMMVHFAITDTSGHSVVVEYINNKMAVTQTPVVTNFYHAKGEKNGIGTAQSRERYDILMDRLSRGNMSIQDVRDALDRVSKDNFGQVESTEWSIVFNQSTGKALYYHRENYKKSYVFNIKQKREDI